MSDGNGPSTPVIPNLALPSLSAIDRMSRLVLGGSAVAILAALIGAALNAWHSTDFLLLVLAGSVAAGVAAWVTATTAASTKPPTLPLATIELAGAAVVGVLAVWRVVELAFDLDQLDRFGDVPGVVMTLVLAGSGIALLVGAVQRDPSIRRSMAAGDQGTRLAVGGLVLVLLGWAVNLSLSYWTMTQAALPLAVATFATVAIVVAPRWTKVLPDVPLAWVGAGFGILGALLALGNWGDLQGLGLRVELGVIDFLGFLASAAGIVLIIAGGVLAGQFVWATRPKAPLAAVVVPTTDDVPTSDPAAPTVEPPADPTDPPD